MSVTSLSDLKFVNADFVGEGISDLPDRPNDGGMTAAQLKAAFDNIAENIIAPRVNDIIDALEDNGSDLIVAVPITGVTGDTVAEQIADLYTQMLGITQGAVTDGSITDAKLDPTGLIADFNNHILDFLMHFRAVETTGGTGSAYTITSVPDVGFYILIANEDCTANATIAGKNVVPSGYTVLEAGQMKANGYYILYYTGTVFRLLNPETHSHTHTGSQITDLSTLLSGKADSVHSHNQSQITGLADALSTITTNISNLPKIRYGSGEPSASLGSNGDIYIKY